MPATQNDRASRRATGRQYLEGVRNHLRRVDIRLTTPEYDWAGYPRPDEGCSAEDYHAAARKTHLEAFDRPLDSPVPAAGQMLFMASLNSVHVRVLVGARSIEIHHPGGVEEVQVVNQQTVRLTLKKMMEFVHSIVDSI
jgi:hypothetical protein